MLDPAGNVVGEATITNLQTGEFTYTAIDPTFNGDVTFDYTIVDPSGATDTASATITVGPNDNPNVNNAPEAGDDFITSTVGEPATGNVLPNDTDPDNPGTPPTLVGIIDPATGQTVAPGTPISIEDPQNPGLSLIHI